MEQHLEVDLFVLFVFLIGGEPGIIVVAELDMARWKVWSWSAPGLTSDTIATGTTGSSFNWGKLESDITGTVTKCSSASATSTLSTVATSLDMNAGSLESLNFLLLCTCTVGCEKGQTSPSRIS